MNRNVFSAAKHGVQVFYSYIARHPWLCSFLLCAVSGLLVWCKGAVILHNDDIQLQFLLTNGGCGYSPYLLHSGYLWGYWWSMVAQILPVHSAWMMLANMILLFVSLWISCFLFFSRAFSRSREQEPFYLWSRTILILLVFFCIRILLGMPMYTLVSISLLLAGMGFILLPSREMKAWKRYGAGAILCFIALCIRIDSLYVGLVYFGVLSALIVCNKGKKMWRQIGICGLGLLGIAGCVWGVNYVGNVQNKEIVQTLSFLKKRISIQDIADNSGIDKYDRYARDCKITREQIDMFKAFIYVPEMEESGQMDQAVSIHQVGMRGLFGLNWLAKRGILSPEWNELSKIRQSPVALSLWVCLCLAGFLYAFVSKRTWHVPVLYGMFVACIVFLLLTQHRLLDRVYFPVVMMALIGMGAYLPRKAAYAIEKWKLYLLVAVMGAGTLFVFRHDRHGLVHLLDSESSPSVDQVSCREYVQAHPHTIFVCAAPLEMLFPESPLDYSCDLFRTTNVIPVGGAWIYYTPAYKSFLVAHGMKDPYVALLADRVVFLVGSHGQVKATKILQGVKESVERKTGQSMEWRLIEDNGKFSCWKAVRVEF